MRYLERLEYVYREFLGRYVIALLVIQLLIEPSLDKAFSDPLLDLRCPPC